MTSPNTPSTPASKPHPLPHFSSKHSIDPPTTPVPSTHLPPAYIRLPTLALTLVTFLAWLASGLATYFHPLFTLPPILPLAHLPAIVGLGLLFSLWGLVAMLRNDARGVLTFAIGYALFVVGHTVFRGMVYLAHPEDGWAVWVVVAVEAVVSGWFLGYALVLRACKQRAMRGMQPLRMSP
ncbi:hypothetical protein BCR44DRAFT_308333 [Catenaria anguillulae PL171]|uniref:Uncharacterized protein n=1 Tax=Catenaria anguillulae PL171 TaxID=765915 RepID=A0A1Y2HUD3_9FUNG|nr:hypothetical protein BCR44DRAFT_308333 [Catenaria anguillulae PL171]